VRETWRRWKPPRRDTGYESRPDYTIVSGDATQAYGAALQEARRSLVYLRPNLVLVYDRLASDMPRQWEWNIHALNPMTVISDKKISIQNDPQRLCVDMLAGPTVQFAQTEVVQVAARDGEFDRVLQRLLADAWRHGAAAVRGRFDPRYVQELSARHCWLRQEGGWTLVRSRHADIMAAIDGGRAFLSRLEGEWWTRFLGGDEEQSAAALRVAPWAGGARPTPSVRQPASTRG
jgi:hypothetical protein